MARARKHTRAIAIPNARAWRWQKAAEDAGLALDAFIDRAVESNIASAMTGVLRLKKHARRAAAAAYDPCDDPHCSQKYNHAGRCDFMGNVEL